MLRTAPRALWAFTMLTTLQACAGSSIIGMPDGGNDLGGFDGTTTGDGSVTGDRPGTSDIVATPDGPAPRAAWTVFVYGHGDHNLATSLENDINKMAEATFGPNLNVIVMADFDATRTVRGDGRLYSTADRMAGRTFPRGTTWYRVRSRVAPEVIRMEPEQNLDDPAVLTASIDYAYRMFPAERYGLILWDHGGSWDGGFGGDHQDGTLPMAGNMAPNALAGAVRAALTARGLTGPRPLEFLSFDTCLMGGAEVMGEIDPLTKVYIANAEIDYGAGWNYTRTFTWLAANPMATPQDFARQEGMDWEMLHANATVTDTLLRSHVAVDMARFGDFTTAAAELARRINLDPSAAERVARVAYLSTPGYSLSLNQSDEEPQRYRDFGQFLNGLSADTMLATSIREQSDVVRMRLQDMILNVNGGTARTSAMQRGVHVALPPVSTFTMPMAMAYAARVPTWANATHWADMLLNIAPSMSSPAPTVVVTSFNTTSPTTAMRPTITLDGTGDLIEGYAVLGSVRAGPPVSFTVLEPLARPRLTAGSPATVSWDGQTTAITGMAVTGDAGSITQPVSVFTVLASSAGTPTMAAPAVVGLIGSCIDATTEEGCTLLCADSGMRMLTPFAVVYGSALPSVMNLDVFVNARARFRPARLVLTQTPPVDGGVSGLAISRDVGQPVLLGAGFMVTSSPAPAGTYGILPLVSDVYGREATGDIVRVDVTTPFGP